MSKTIYDAYLYKYKKFILIISHTPGLSVDLLVDDISKAFNLKKIKLNNLNYDELNNKINKYLEENDFNINNNLKHYLGMGLVIYGNTFPTDKLKFKQDLQLHVSSSLKMFLKYDNTNTKEIYDNLSKELVNNKINKYYNIKQPIDIEFNNKVFDKIIDFIMFKVYDKENYKLYSKKLNDISNTITELDSTELDKLDSTELDKLDSTELDNLDSTELDNIESTDIDYSDSIESSYNYSKLSTLYNNLLNLNNISNKEINELLRYI